jgi:hypothetical protein
MGIFLGEKTPKKTPKILGEKLGVFIPTALYIFCMFYNGL